MATVCRTLGSSSATKIRIFFFSATLSPFTFSVKTRVRAALFSICSVLNNPHRSLLDVSRDWKTMHTEKASKRIAANSSNDAQHKEFVIAGACYGWLDMTLIRQWMREQIRRAG